MVSTMKRGNLEFKTTNINAARNELTEEGSDIVFTTFSKSTGEFIGSTMLDVEGIEGRLRELLVSYEDECREHGRRLSPYSPSIRLVNQSRDKNGRQIQGGVDVRLTKKFRKIWDKRLRHAKASYDYRGLGLLTIETNLEGCSYKHIRVFQSVGDVFEVQDSKSFRTFVLEKPKRKFEEVVKQITEVFDTGVMLASLRKPLVVKVKEKLTFSGNTIEGLMTFTFNMPETPLEFAVAREKWLRMHASIPVRAMGVSQTHAEIDSETDSEQTGVGRGLVFG